MPPNSATSFPKGWKLLGISIALLAAFVSLVERNLERLYVFDLESLHDVAKQGIQLHGNDTGATVQHIVKELSSQYPSHINTHEEWVFNNAGGAMGAMWLLHASITEYIIIFGSAVGTEGHTGRHTVDNYFHILSGTELAFYPGEFTPEVYPPGSRHHLKRGVVKQYKMPEACFALEYSRGWIPPMLFFGFADGLTSTLDVPTLWATIRITGYQMISNLLKGKF